MTAAIRQSRHVLPPTLAAEWPAGTSGPPA